MEYAGVKAENSDMLFLDPDVVKGSTLSIYVPYRSRVDFFQGARLLTSQVLNPGLQEVDTTTFPHGSYDVDVVINEGSGNAIRERHFFTKSGLLVATSRPVFTLEGGYARNNTEISSDPIWHAGLRWRALSFLELDPAAYGSDEQQIASIGAVGIYRGIQLVTQYAQSTEGTSGVYGSVQGKLPGDISWYVSGLKTRGGDDVDDFTVVEDATGDPFDQELEITPDLSSWSWMVERVFGDLRLFYLGNRNNRVVRRSSFFQTPAERAAEFNQPRYAHGPGFEWKILGSGVGGNFLNLRTSYLWTDEGTGFQGVLSYTRNLGENLNSISTIENNSAARTRTDRVTTGLQYHASGRAGYGTRAELREELLRQRVEEGKSRNSLLTNASLDYGHEYFRARGYVYDQHGSDTGGTSLGVYGDTSLLYSGGKVSVAYGSTIDSALVIEVVTSTAVKSGFDVVVNGAYFDTVPIGRTLVVPLAPFARYRVAIRHPETARELVAYDANDYEVTLFPGNFVKRTWSAEKVFVLTGRVIDEEGNPVSYQRIRGPKDYTITEDDGVFQVEISGGERLYIESEKYRCEFTAPDLKGADYVVDVGDIQCHASRGTDKAQLSSSQSMIRPLS